MPAPHITRVRWSTLQANVGDTGQLSAEVENPKPNTSVTLIQRSSAKMGAGVHAD